MAKSKKKEPLCLFHRTEAAMNDLSAEWRAKAAKLSPQAAKALAQSLRSLRTVLDRRIHDIEEKEHAGKA